MALYSSIRLLLTCLWLGALSGCMFSDVRRQAIEIESVSSITGEVIFQSTAQGNPLVKAHRYNSQHLETIRSQHIKVDGTFKINLFPGRYAISAFIDENNNSIWDEGEHGSYPGMENRYPLIYEMKADNNITLPPLVISGELRPPSDITVKRSFGNAMKNTGKPTSLEDPMFDPASGRMALWRPLDFVAQFGGGLLFLQPYSAEKTPLLFVHGIGGSAREFSEIIESVDQTRFQPWVYQYPSGMSLYLVSDFLEQELARLHSRHNFQKIVLIAHSMGGLVIRDFVLTHAGTEASYELALAMTINSPLLGIDSAAKAVDLPPFTIPSWRDVASGSPFIQNLHASRWPEDVPYHLVFSYLKGKDGDGVASMSKQLSQALQDEARIRGFEKGHAAILKDGEFIDFLNRQLDTVRH